MELLSPHLWTNVLGDILLGVVITKGGRRCPDPCSYP